MRTTLLVILLLTMASVGVFQYLNHSGNSKQTGNTNSPMAADGQEDSLMQQAIDQVMPLFEDADNAPSAKPEPTISIDDLNLSLPVTVHPTTPALNLPENNTLVLPPKKEQPKGVSVGAGIEWDERNQKAKGAKITITVPTG